MARILLLLVVCIHFSLSQAQTVPLLSEEIERRESWMGPFSQPVQLRRWEMVADTVEGWKEWEMVENFSFGINRGTMTMITDLESLHPYFRDKVIELIRVCKSKGITLAVVETYRTRAKQNEYKSMGRRYTRSKPGKSKHQYGMAVDVVPMVASPDRARAMA